MTGLVMLICVRATVFSHTHQTSNKCIGHGCSQRSEHSNKLILANTIERQRGMHAAFTEALITTGRSEYCLGFEQA